MARRREDDIFDACSRGEKEVVVRMISAGTDPRQLRNPNLCEETLLHTACRYVVHAHLVYKLRGICRLFFFLQITSL